MDGSPGKTVYTCMLNREAGIEADLTVSLLEDGGSGGPLDPFFQGRGFYIAAAGGAAYQNWAHIQQTIQVKAAVFCSLKILSSRDPHKKIRHKRII